MIGKLEEHVLLGVQRAARNATASTIFEYVAENYGDANFGAVFTTLRRLETKGLLKRRDGGPNEKEGSKQRVTYHITGEGSAALQSSLDMTYAAARKAGFAF